MSALHYQITSEGVDCHLGALCCTMLRANPPLAELGARGRLDSARREERPGVPQRLRGRDGKLCGVSARVLARSKYAALGECYRRSPGGGVSSIYS